MRLNLVKWARAEEGGRALRVRCLGCQQWVLLSGSYADLDGEPFVAYYCPPCGEHLIDAGVASVVEFDNGFS